MQNDTKKYVQVRFESNKSQKALGMILHNTRKIKPNYLRDNLPHNKENNTFYIFDENCDYDRYDIKDKQIQTKVNEILKQQLQDTINKEKKNNKNFREKKHAIYQDSVITLSNSINDLYVNGDITKEKLNELFLKSVYDLTTDLNIKPLYIAIHYDEKTPHAHIAYINYYNKKSINNKLKKSYSKAQDIVANAWNEIGFKRGISKTITKEKHLTLPQMHQKEKEIELNTLDNKIKKDCLEIVNSSTVKKLTGEKIEKKPLLSKIYNKLKTYTNYNFISKVENENKSLQDQLQYKQNQLDQTNLENQTLLNRLQNLLTERTNTQKLVDTIKSETTNLINTIKKQSTQITYYKELLEKHNINIEKNKPINNNIKDMKI